ncbi:hypothetical protein HDV01_001744 [Terramyces sp. JEL0728]|nr:hypothetical protein HDV01_001744 [Terramyces sp. JEL0728]
MQEQELLDWLAIQLLSLISPSSVDLTWYTTPEAWDCPNISLRNYVTLAKGIKLIASNFADKLSTQFSYNKALLDEKLHSYQESLSKLSETVLQDAKAGESSACKKILAELYNIWKLSQLEENKYQAEKSEAITEKEEDYPPTERTFRPMIQWMLQKIKYLLVRHPLLSQSKLLETINSHYTLVRQTDKTCVPKRTIQALCDCELYNTLNKLMFLSKETKQLENNLDFKKDSFSAFLDNLSVHINIVAAFISADIRSISLEPTVKYLTHNFSSFDSTVMYPYDMEDAILIWMNQCLTVLKKHEEYKAYVDHIPEFDDLTQDLENGWMMCMAIAGYYPEKCKGLIKKIKIGTGLSKSKIEKNYKLLQELVDLTNKDLVIPWTPIDIVSSIDNQNIASGNLSYLIVSFLGRFLGIVQKKNMGYLDNKANSKMATDVDKSGQKLNNEIDLQELQSSPENQPSNMVDKTENIIVESDSLIESQIKVEQIDPPMRDNTSETPTEPVWKTADLAAKVTLKVPVKARPKSSSRKKKKSLKASKSLDLESKSDPNTVSVDINTAEYPAADCERPKPKGVDIESLVDNNIQHGPAIENERPKSKRKSASGTKKNSLKNNATDSQGDVESNPLLLAAEMITEQLDEFYKIERQVSQTNSKPDKTVCQETTKPVEGDNTKILLENASSISTEILKSSTILLDEIAETAAFLDKRVKQESERGSPLSDTNSTSPSTDTVSKPNVILNKNKEQVIQGAQDQIEKETKFKSKKKKSSAKKSRKKEKSHILNQDPDEMPFLACSPSDHPQTLFSSTARCRDDDRGSLPAIGRTDSAEIAPVQKKSQVEQLPSIFSQKIESFQNKLDVHEEYVRENPHSKSSTPKETVTSPLLSNGSAHDREDLNSQACLSSNSQVKDGLSSDDDELDDELDDATWNMILKIRNSSEQLIKESNSIAKNPRESNTFAEGKITKESQFDRIKFNDTMIDSDDDELAFIPSNRGGTAIAAEETHQTPRPISRPRTGLQSYPLPESDGENEPQDQPLDLNDAKGEESWQRVQKMKRLGKITLKSKTTKPRKVYDENDRKPISATKLEPLKQSPAKSKQEKEEETARKKVEQVLLQEQIISEKLKRKSEKLVESARQTPKPPKPASSKLRKTLSTKSNKSLIKNALMHVCLAGNLNKGVKEEVLQVLHNLMQDLKESDANHFVILLRDVNNFAFRGLYFWDPNLDQTLKLYSGSPGPTELDPAGVLEFYKYDSGARTFKPIPTKSFGRTVDAIAIGRDYFVPNK